MKKQLIKIIFLLSIFSSDTIAQKVIFTFNKDVNLKDWVIVNDNVMGGVSKSKLIINKSGNGVFFGNISTAYNGGFASVRYNCKRKYINEYKSVVLRIKGDKKEYQLRLKSSVEDYHSYIYPFKTSGEWELITIPLNEMYASFRGRRLNMKNFNENYLEQIAILIGNKRNENFNLLIDSVILE
jgi:NADH dehydrogenase [ubiquinone] 1 alpha subcomplex assembly factor 1